MHEVQADRRRVVLDLLAEGVREPREPPHVHPQGEILPFDLMGVVIVISLLLQAVNFLRNLVW